MRHPAQHRTISTAASPHPLVLLPASTSVSQPVATALAAAVAAAAATGLLLTASVFAGPALAYNVRLQDVESPVLQAGLRAATSGEFVEAERVRAVLT